MKDLLLKIEPAKENGKETTCEETLKHVTAYDIECQLWEEIKANPKYAAAVEEHNKRLAAARDPNTIVGKLRETSTGASEPIISKEAWDKVQKARKTQK